MKFKVGDKVKIIKNEWDSINHIGDIGTITEINNLDYRVYVKDRDYQGAKNIGNWHGEDELEIIKLKK